MGFFLHTALSPAQCQHRGAHQSLHRGPQRGSHRHQLLMLAMVTFSMKPASWCTRCAAQGAGGHCFLRQPQRLCGGPVEQHAACRGATCSMQREPRTSVPSGDMPGLSCPAFSSTTVSWQAVALPGHVQSLFREMWTASGSSDADARPLPCSSVPMHPLSACRAM